MQLPTSLIALVAFLPFIVLAGPILGATNTTNPLGITRSITSELSKRDSVKGECYNNPGFDANTLADMAGQLSEESLNNWAKSKNSVTNMKFVIKEGIIVDWRRQGSANNKLAVFPSIDTDVQTFSAALAHMRDGCGAKHFAAGAWALDDKDLEKGALVAQMVPASAKIAQWNRRKSDLMINA